MARYVTPVLVNSITTSTTLTAPAQGLYNYIPSGTGSGVVITLPAPLSFYGTILTFYNASASSVTLSTPTGTFTGTGSSTITVQTLQTMQVIADGVNGYTVIVGTGGPAAITYATIGLVSHSAAATISTSGTQQLTITAAGNLALSSSGASYNVTVPYPKLGIASTSTAVPNLTYVNSLLTTSAYWERSW